MRLIATVAAAVLLLAACTRQEDMASRDLIHAVEMGDMRGVRFYMKNADLNKADDFGRTPVSIALLRNEIEVARLLFEAGAKYPEGGAGKTPITYYMIAWKDVDMLRLMLENGANPNEEYADADKRRTTPLIQSTRMDLAPLVTLLIEKGADPEQKCEGRTALEVGKSGNCPRAVKALIDGGAKETAD